MRQTLSVRCSAWFLGLVTIFLLGLLVMASSKVSHPAVVAQQDLTASLPLILNGSGSSVPANERRVNAPFFDGEITFFRRSLFWFGKVNSSENYADVRVGYNTTHLFIDVHIIDRRLWYDLTPSVQDLTDWDAVTLLMSTSQAPGSLPGASEIQWVAQMNHWQPREDYQAVYQGDGTGWSLVSLPFVTSAVWRGEGLNGDDIEGKGWWVSYEIPFSSLGYSSPPHDAVWRLGVKVHDRDTSTGPTLAEKIWPEGLNSLEPGTWGSLHFGMPTYQPSTPDFDGTTVIRNGEQGMVVEDAHVGGAFTCGEGIDHWTEWGNTNYESIYNTQINIQNQRDVSDWPCFSKYYIVFPLDLIPEGAEVISATLTMFHFGNSAPSSAVQSMIHTFVIREAWEDDAITWNNAPLAWENISRNVVNPLLEYPGWPGIPYDWDVSYAVADALTRGEPLRLALYSSDSAIHSGKYFFSSDSNSDGSARPFLTVNWKNP